MKKILIILLMIISLCCGCEKSVDQKYTNKAVNDNFYIYTDVETCVEYFVSYGVCNAGSVYPRYKQDGTLKVNERCLNEKNYKSN